MCHGRSSRSRDNPLKRLSQIGYPRVQVVGQRARVPWPHCVGRRHPWQNAAVAQEVAECPRPAAIEAHDLTKRFGARRAGDSLSIRVPRGVIAGLVGPNGAGKTTTLRMLLGLIRPTGGSASIFGHSIRHPRAFMHSVGALIEGPAFYPTLSGRTNLSTLATLGRHRDAD